MENFNIINYVSIGALIASVIFSFLIIFSKKNNSGHKLFSLFLLSIGVILMFFVLLDFERSDLALYFLPLLMVAVLSLGPLLWIYMKSVIGEGSTRLVRHLILPVSYFIVISALLGLQTYFEEGAVAEIISTLLLYLVVVGLSVFFLVQNVYYIIKSFVLYRSHLLMVSNTYSYTEKVNLSWLRVLIYGYMFFIVGLVLAHIVEDSWSSYFFYFTILIYVIFAGYNALIQQPIERFEEANRNEEQRLEAGSVTKIDISSDFFNNLKQRLVSKMVDEKLFLDSGLNIHQLAEDLNTNSKYISTLINQEFGINFVSFINEYRIEEAKNMLLDVDKSHLTIEGICYDSGFKSKSVFNVVFKKMTGLTPTGFIKEDVKRKIPKRE